MARPFCDDQGPSDTRVILILIAAMTPRALGAEGQHLHAIAHLPCIARVGTREDGRGVQQLTACFNLHLRVDFTFFTPQKFLPVFFCVRTVHTQYGFRVNLVRTVNSP